MRTSFIKYDLKKYAYVAVVAAMTGSMTGCQDQLKEEVFNFYDVNEFFKNTDMLNMAVNGVYECFSDNGMYGQNWIVYDTDTDIAHVKGAGIGHVARDLGHFNAYAEHSWLEKSWELYYKAIDRANTVLEHQYDVKLEGKQDSIYFNNLIAQTKCLRALAYFDLTILFGDVPVKLTASKDGDNFKLPRNPRSEVYDQIIADFSEAIPHLADKSTEERMTKGAAKGFLARTYLYRGGYSLYGTADQMTGEMKRPDNYLEYYQKANELLTDIMNSGQHGLLDSYERVFRNMCELTFDPFENMYEVAFFTPAGQIGGASVMGTYNGPEIAQTSIYGRANSFIKTHHFFADYFEAGDLRKNTAVATFRITANDAAANTTSELAKNQSYNWSPGKWRRNWHTGAVKDNNNTDVNYVLLRYADILLMRAEVENEINNGPTTVAIECVNQVRRRAFGKPYLEANAEVDFEAGDFAGKEDFFNYLYTERARELCFEGLRKFDLIRWNKLGFAIKETSKKFTDAIADKVLKAYTFEAGERFQAGKHELYPIPAREIRETNGALTQNPGYGK